MNVDGRYGFKLNGMLASLKLTVDNLFGTRSWDLTDAGAYNIYWDSGRRLDVRLIVDL